MTQSKLELIYCNWHYARENLCERVTIEFCFLIWGKSATKFLCQLCGLVMQNQLVFKWKPFLQQVRKTNNGSDYKWIYESSHIWTAENNMKI